MSDLPLSRIVDVSISTSPQAIQRVGFGVLNIVTAESGGVTRFERYRTYSSIDSVAGDWDSDTEAYKSAQTYFSQQPSPSEVMISTRYPTAQSALLQGGVVTTDSLPDFQAISDGSFKVAINGVNQEVTGLDFTSAVDLTGVATVIDTGLSAFSAGCIYDDENLVFQITTDATGDGATLSYLGTATSGTDISELLQMQNAEQGALIADGLDAETITASLNAIEDKAGNDYYGFQFTKEVRDDVEINGEDAVIAAASWAEARVKIFFNTTNDLNTLNAAVTSDIASKLQSASYRRTITTYSSYPSQYPSASVAGRAFTVNFDVPNSTITLMFKQLPSITSEDLTFSQAETLDAKACNYLTVTGGVIFYQTGQMASGVFLDEVHGIDALESDIQVDVANLLYQSTTKIPYTNGGVQQIISVIRKVLDRYVLNGLLAAGYTTDAFGNDYYLPSGYEISFIPVQDVSQSDKDIREYNGISFLCLGAGAIHKVTVSGTFER